LAANTFDNGNVDRQINNKPPDVFFKEALAQINT